MNTRLPVFLALTAVGLCLAKGETPVVVLPDLPGKVFAKAPLDSAILDREQSVEWCAGRETPLSGDAGKSAEGLAQLLCVSAQTPSATPLSYGQASIPGQRQVRLAFQSPVSTGSIVVHGDGRLSVLKADAAFPGDLADDSQWLPAERMSPDGKVIADEVIDPDALTLWTLPPGTQTRALRLTHTAEVTDTDYAGQLGGLFILPDRYRNLSALATASASARSELATRVLNGRSDSWNAWENQDKGPSDTPVLSPEHPEWITLSWDQPVKIEALLAIWAGIATLEIDSYRGPETLNPRDAKEQDWQPIARYEHLQHRYAAPFWPNALILPQPVTTRALRLKILAAGEARSHATNNEGRRTWLGEVMALGNIGAEPLTAASAAAQAPHAPVAIPFHLDAPGYVSLVIERPDGFRVRNLISETWFPAGDQTAWWDGSDDLTRDADAAEHGVYHIPSRLVAPGDYRVRGIVRGEIVPRYEFSVYAPGDPPWTTNDSTGGWLANHTPPQSALFVPAAQSPTGGQPAVYLGCYVTEGPSGLAWVDLEGKKLGGKKWLGGAWTAAPFLARDAGPHAAPEVLAYAASVWESAADKTQGELRLTALTRGEDRAVAKEVIGPVTPGRENGSMEDLIAGLAVRDGIAVVSAKQAGRLLIYDTATGKRTKEVSVVSPRGLTFDADGALWVLSQQRLLRFATLEAKPEVVVAKGLEDPAGLTLDAAGMIYVSDHGRSHQVKVFDRSGHLKKTYGRPGAPQAGAYDPLHMKHPLGLAVDERGNLWVTEHDFLPKRVSVWSPEGKLLKAFYGPGKYGGGGSLDPRDPAKFYYADEGRGMLEFTLDWQAGTSQLTRVPYRQEMQAWPLPERSAAPEQAIYWKDRRYFTNAWNSNPTGGADTVFLFLDHEGLVRPVAGMGRARNWEVLGMPEFRSRWPEGLEPGERAQAFFAWSDANGDFTPQPDEVTMIRGDSGGVTVMPDLSFCVARLEDAAKRFRPVEISETGVPRYDLTAVGALATEVAGPRSSGGDQVLSDDSGWSVVTLGVAPFDPLSICGVKDGKPMWSYPNLWPGLHASHNAPQPDRPGEVIGATRLPGGFFEVQGSDAGPLWALHTNHGIMDLFTRDGIFVASLFKDMRGGKSWTMPVAQRGMDLSGVSLNEENFWPTLSYSAAGKTYLVDGNRSAIVRLDGLNSIRRISGPALRLGAEELAACSRWQADAEAARQKRTGSGVLHIVRREKPPAVDGDAADWEGVDWAEIDKSGVKAYFNSNSKPHDITAALCIAGDRLYGCWRTSGEMKELKNSGEMVLAPFKTGDALDLMLGPDGNRSTPVAGDLRLLVTVVKGQPRAMLYRAVVPGTKPEARVAFSSPWRTITFDQVEDVSADVEFATKEGDYEVSIPLAKLGLLGSDATRLRGDIGVLRGEAGQTLNRSYWNNKAAGIISDVPEEASLYPRLWGTLEISK